MADFASLKSKIVTKLQTLSVNSETVFDTTGVFTSEPDFSSALPDPFVIVVASDNESDYANTTENRRMYGFVLRVHMERKERGHDTAETDLTEIVDAILDAFDQDITLTGSALMVQAAPSQWLYSLGLREDRVAEIKIRAMVYFDTSI